MTPRTAALPALLASLLLAPPAAAQLDLPVRTRSGAVAGVPGSDPAVRVFRGIPYAAPPVGELRWKAPREPGAWTGVRHADRFAPGCVQALAGSRPPWTEEFMHQGEVGEDCLYLNVWTAARAADERRPVLVYVHGGGFNEGSGSVRVYDGEALSRKGPVVVTINYRLGVLGFLAHPELSAEASGASGNYGLLDQVAALRWVRDNIAGFGGDPGNVTVAGQSAGAMSVYLLTASPLARGLFHRAIVESGPGALAAFGLASTAQLARPLAAAEAEGAAFARAKHAPTLRELRALSVADLTAPLPAGERAPRFGPVLDGAFLPADVPTVYAGGRQNDVPMLMGMNADEGSAFPGYGRSTVEDLRKTAEARYGDAAARFLALYPAATDSAAARARVAAMRDEGLALLGRVAAEHARSPATNTYVYYFARGIPWPERPEFGAFHTAEVPYVFDNLRLLPRPWTPVDRRLAEVTSSYWAAFAARGEPSAPGLPAWQPYERDPGQVMVLGEEIGMRALPDAPRRAFFEAVGGGGTR